MSRHPQKKSEIQELREQLASNIIKEKKIAIRKVLTYTKIKFNFYCDH